jgi:hypothetical protein
MAINPATIHVNPPKQRTYFSSLTNKKMKLLNTVETNWGTTI